MTLRSDIYKFTLIDHFSTLLISFHDAGLAACFLKQQGIYVESCCNNFFSDFVKNLWLTGVLTIFINQDLNFGISKRYIVTCT